MKIPLISDLLIVFEPLVSPQRMLPPTPKRPALLPKLAILNAVTLSILDSCHYNIQRGSTYWSPGYSILLMGASRVAIMPFMAELWLVGYSIAFVVYGGALAREVGKDVREAERARRTTFSSEHFFRCLALGASLSAPCR